MDQKDNDWMAFILLVFVFAALLVAILVIGTDLQLPFLSRRL